MAPASNVVPFLKPRVGKPDNQRLAAALAGLVSALNEQLRQIRHFRAAAGRLAAETAALKESMGTYRTRLSGLAANVGTLHDRSRQLAARMEMPIPPPRGY